MLIWERLKNACVSAGYARAASQLASQGLYNEAKKLKPLMNREIITLEVKRQLFGKDMLMRNFVLHAVIPMTIMMVIMVGAVLLGNIHYILQEKDMWPYTDEENDLLSNPKPRK